MKEYRSEKKIRSVIDHVSQPATTPCRSYYKLREKVFGSVHPPWLFPRYEAEIWARVWYGRRDYFRIRRDTCSHQPLTLTNSTVRDGGYRQDGTGL